MAYDNGNIDTENGGGGQLIDTPHGRYNGVWSETSARLDSGNVETDSESWQWPGTNVPINWGAETEGVPPPETQTALNAFYKGSTDAKWRGPGTHTVAPANVPLPQVQPQNGKMAYYQQIGHALLGQQVQAQLQQSDGGGGGAISSDAGNLTGGFNMNWLAQSLASGSANGAKI